MATELIEGSIKRMIMNAQHEWGQRIIGIGKKKCEPEEYTKLAKEMLDDLYDFQNGGFIMFKPTVAIEEPIRTTFGETLSYFIGGALDDYGFALNPWNEVEFEKDFYYTVLGSGEIMVMGRCKFTPAKGAYPITEVTKADYTLGFRNTNGGLRIFLHHSSQKVVRVEPAPEEKAQ